MVDRWIVTVADYDGKRAYLLASRNDQLVYSLKPVTSVKPETIKKSLMRLTKEHETNVIYVGEKTTLRGKRKGMIEFEFFVYPGRPIDPPF